MQSLADYNNNPGNLRPPGGKKNFYEGQIGIDENGFAIFEDRSFGQRALNNDIKTKLDNGFNTPRKFVNRYAPASKENSEEGRKNYMVQLAGELGLDSIDQEFPKDSISKISDVIYRFESGNELGQESKQDETLRRSDQDVPTHFGLDTTGLVKEPDKKVSFSDQAGELMRMALESGQGADPRRVLEDVAAAAIGSKVPARLESFMQGYQNPPSKPPGVMGGALPTTPAAPSALPTPPAPIPTDPMHTRQMQGTTDAGTTGRARQQTYNLGTAQQAAAAKEQANVLNQLRNQGIISNTAESILAKSPGLTSTASGVVMPAGQVYADIPPTQGTKPTPQPPAPPQPKGPGVLSRMQSGYRQAFPVGKTSFAGALGGLGMAEGARETQRRYEEDDMIGAMLAGLGTVGSAGAMTPFPPARIAGTVAATASPLALYLYDKMKNKQTGSLPLPAVYARYQR